MSIRRYCTLETLAHEDEILGHVEAGSRGFVFTRMPTGEFGITSVSFSKSGEMTKAHFTWVLRPERVPSLVSAIMHAATAYEEGRR